MDPVPPSRSGDPLPAGERGPGPGLGTATEWMWGRRAEAEDAASFRSRSPSAPLPFESLGRTSEVLRGEALLPGDHRRIVHLQVSRTLGPSALALHLSPPPVIRRLYPPSRRERARRGPPAPAPAHGRTEPETP